MQSSIINAWQELTRRLQGAGEVLPCFILRLIMGWEFWESGLEKLHGENWFAQIQDRFPFPFNSIPASISWSISTWFELIGAVMLWVGLGTRFFAFSLLFLTFVATAAVHWPSMLAMWSDLAKGYAITDMGHGNFKLPLLFSVMLLPLIFNGAGKFSLDHIVTRLLSIQPPPINDVLTWALACTVIGIPFLMLLPKFGAALLILAIILGFLHKYYTSD